MSAKTTWPEEVRLKMIEKSEFYSNPDVYNYGFYDGYQTAIENECKLSDENKILKSELESLKRTIDNLLERFINP